MADRRTRRIGAIVAAVLQATDDYVPEELPFEGNDSSLAFALSAIRRMADLIDAELTLASPVAIP